MEILLARLVTGLIIMHSLRYDHFEYQYNNALSSGTPFFQ